MIRRLKRWQAVLLAFAAAFSVVLTNCTNQGTNTAVSPNPAAGAGAGGSAPTANQSALVFGSGGQPANLEPGNIEDGNSLYAQHQIYDRLIDSAPGKTDLVPALATEWNTPDDGKTWRLTLREGVKFHDGTDFNAEAVRFNVNRWWDPKDPNGFRSAGKSYAIWSSLFGGYKGDENSLMQAVNVIDSKTIEFVLKEPFAAFPAAISSGYFGIASPTAVKQAGARYGTPGSVAVGTGPYVFKEWRSGDRIVYEANPNYWNGAPKSQNLVIRFIQEPSARLAELRSGTVDFTVDLAPDQLQEVSADANLKVVKRPSFNVGYLGLNPSYEPLSKPEVRRAIAMAINKGEIVKAFWGDLAQSDSNFLPPSMETFRNKQMGQYEFNPDQAKQLLAQAGYPNGFDLDLWYMPVSRPYFPTPKPIAEAFAADLSAIGIRVKLNTKDWAAYLEDRLKAPGYQAFMLGWTGDYGDPDNFMFAHFGPGATKDLGNWKNDQVFNLLTEARKTGDQAKRAEYYQQAEQILFNEAVRIPIVHSEPLLGQRANIQGWSPSPLGSESFEQISKG